MNKLLIVLAIVLVCIILPIKTIGQCVITSENITAINSNSFSRLENHSWLMYRHDARNTGRSTIDTNNNSGGIYWQFLHEWSSEEPVSIDTNGTIYIPTFKYIHAIYSNGTKKWSIQHNEDSYTPAIGKQGKIFVGTDKHLYGFYPNGSIYWIFDIEKKFCGTITIGPNGTLYTGTDDGYLYALNQDGTLIWDYYVGTNDYILDPAVDNQGNVYFTTVYTNGLYCLNPNGTLKWKYIADSDFSFGPVIADDGTIYGIPTHEIIALYPDGSEKWNKSFTYWSGHPSIMPDGTIILTGKGTDYITALDPVDGDIIWQYLISDSVNYIDKTEVAIGADGTIFFAYVYSNKIGYMCALTSDGILKWETHLQSILQPYVGLAILSEPSIGSDGSVYITTWFIRDGSNFTDYGYLYAIGQEIPAPPPLAPSIVGEINGKYGEPYEYAFQTTSSSGGDVYYFIDWGDYNFENWIGPYPSGIPVRINHTWETEGTYTIRAKAKSIDHLCGPWTTLEISMPYTHPYPALHWLQQYFPLLARIIDSLFQFD